MTLHQLGTRNDRRSAYERIGGAVTVCVIVDDLMERFEADPHLAPLFASLPDAAVRRHAEMLLGHLLGGPPIYEMTRLRAAHGDLGITGDQYAAGCGHLDAALADADVPADIRDLMMIVLTSLERVIARTRIRAAVAA